MRRLNLFAARGLQGVESAREEEFVARDLKGLKDFSVDTPSNFSVEMDF